MNTDNSKPRWFRWFFVRSPFFFWIKRTRRTFHLGSKHLEIYVGPEETFLSVRDIDRFCFYFVGWRRRRPYAKFIFR